MARTWSPVPLLLHSVLAEISDFIDTLTWFTLDLKKPDNECILLGVLMIGSNTRIIKFSSPNSANADTALSSICWFAFLLASSILLFTRGDKLKEAGGFIPSNQSRVKIPCWCTSSPMALAYGPGSTKYREPSIAPLSVLNFCLQTVGSSHSWKLSNPAP